MVRFRVLFLCLALVACAPEKTPSCCENEIAAESVLPDTSIFHLDSAWTNQNGKSVRLTAFRGRPTVVAMMFTSCQYACPRILADLRKIESGLAAENRDGVQFLLASFDTERDQPEVLKAYAAEQGLDPRRWTLLHGSADAVRELAAVLGVKYKPSPAVGFAHSNIITILDGEGRISHRQTGLGGDGVKSVATLQRALSKD